MVLNVAAFSVRPRARAPHTIHNMSWSASAAARVMAPHCGVGLLRMVLASLSSKNEEEEGFGKGDQNSADDLAMSAINVFRQSSVNNSCFYR